MTFARSTDYAAITELLTELRSWRRMANDDAPAPSAFHARAREGLDYVMATDAGGRPAAVFLLDRWFGAPAAEVHFCFRPGQWGNTERIARDFVAWVWANTGIQRLTGRTPDYNRLALRLAKAVGFREVGRQQGAGLRRGRPYGLVLTELEKQ